MFHLAANIELMFTEAGPDHGKRVAAAAAEGFDAVEMWGTTDKNVGELTRVLNDNGVTLTSMVAEPNVNLVFPGTDLQPFFEGLDRAIDDAQRLACSRIVVRPGMGFPGFNRQRNLAQLVEIYGKVVERIDAKDLVILLEPVNTRIDHPGLLLDRTSDAAGVIRAVGSAKLRLLFDFYHSAVEGESAADELAQAADLLGYVQFADFPGRGEPGAGTIDWTVCLSLLEKAGYTGPIGLECVPTQNSPLATQHIRDLAGRT